MFNKLLFHIKYANMPPSGFIKSEANLIATFAESIIGRLKEEVSEGKYPTFREAVESELVTIEQALQDEENLELTTKGVLLLTQCIYQKIQITSVPEMLAEFEDLPKFQVLLPSKN